MLVDALRRVLAAIVAVAVATPTGPAPAEHRRLPAVVVGADVSWPNCPEGLGIPSRPTLGKPLPRASARFVVIGLTNGPAFHPNPCLVSHVTFARERGLWAGAYAVATYPTPRQLARYGDRGPRPDTTLRGRLFNTGWAQARVNLATMRAAGLHAPAVWVDVEPVSAPAPWSGRPRRNQAVVDGVLAGYRAAGLGVGFYSVPRLWRGILGSARYRLPEWRTAGPQDRRAALGRCRGPAFQGGRAVLAQWWDTDRDHDVLCPGRPAGDVLQTWFVRLRVRP
jgi:hypothetical protein